MTERAVQLEIPSGAEFVALARLVVSAMAAGETQLSDDPVDDLNSAGRGGGTNGIEAHAALDTEERVVVECWADESHLEVLIEDRGTGFDVSNLPEHPPVTDPERLKFERGLGIPLIRALVDEVEFSSSDDGTAVRLVMHHDDELDGESS